MSDFKVQFYSPIIFFFHKNQASLIIKKILPSNIIHIMGE